MILCLWPPLHPFSKLLAIQDHAQNLEQLWMGGRREVSILSHRPVTSSDSKQEWLFFRESVSTFLQLVVEAHSERTDVVLLQRVWMTDGIEKYLSVYWVMIPQETVLEGLFLWNVISAILSL